MTLKITLLVMIRIVFAMNCKKTDYKGIHDCFIHYRKYVNHNLIITS